MTLKATDSLTTPDWLFNRLHADFNFTLDSAASSRNAKLPRYYTAENNGLPRPWNGETVWCNPPYSGKNLAIWARKCHNEHLLRGSMVVMLVPVSVSSIWWRKYAIKSEVFFFHRRIKFGNTNSTGLRDSVLLVFRQPRWYPLGNNEADMNRRAEWDCHWRDLLYPASDFAGRWWPEPKSKNIA